MSGAAPRAAGPRTNNVPSAVVKLSDYLAAAHKRYGAMADEYLKLYPATTGPRGLLPRTTRPPAIRARSRSWMV